MLVHIEIEVFLRKPILHLVEPINRWHWLGSYSPKWDEALSFHELINEYGLLPLPFDTSLIVQQKYQSWYHQETTWWCSFAEFMDYDFDTSMSRWFLEWVQPFLPHIAQPEDLRILIWVSEGNYDEQ